MAATPFMIALVPEGGGFDLFQWQPGAAIWTLIIFLGALPLMIKFVFGPIVKALDERDQKVEAAAAAAEDAKRAALAAVEGAAKERDEARAQARKLVQDATDRAARQAAETLETAKAAADEQMARAMQDIEVAKRRALLEIRQEVIDLSIASATRILQRDVDDEAHRKMVEDFLGSRISEN